MEDFVENTWVEVLCVIKGDTIPIHELVILFFPESLGSELFSRCFLDCKGIRIEDQEDSLTWNAYGFIQTLDDLFSRF